MSDAHDQLLAGVRVSERMWCESDLYWRTNRWAEDGRSMDISESGRWAQCSRSSRRVRSCYQRIGR